MKKKQPKNAKTIADLKIVWNFDYDPNESVSDRQCRFERLNPDLVHLKIKCGNYVFLSNAESLQFYFEDYYGVNLDSVSIASFIEVITWKFHFGLLKNVKLDRFELVSENTFRVHSTPL